MLVTLTKQPTLAIRFRSPPPEMAARVPAALVDVRAAVDALELRVAGPGYTRYLEHRPEEGVFVLEVGFPVDRAAEGTDRVAASELPGGAAILIWHDGPYASLGESHARLAKVVEERGSKASWWAPTWRAIRPVGRRRSPNR